MKEYFSGKKLYGDDFTFEQIKNWYLSEQEAYAEISVGEATHYEYYYHTTNQQLGYRFLPKNRKFTHVLGLGAAFGYEYKPIAERIENLHILEPSSKLRSEKIYGLSPNYKKPALEGKIEYPDNFFDLITCFGTLHHIPNVSFVVSELARVLKPDGYLLIREPINSLGDWRVHRFGLTKHERGIPLPIFRTIFQNSKLQIVKESPCFAMTSVIHRAIGKLLPKPIFSYLLYIKFDHFISRLLLSNYNYHPTSKRQRFAPHDVFYVLKK